MGPGGYPRPDCPNDKPPGGLYGKHRNVPRIDLRTHANTGFVTERERRRVAACPLRATAPGLPPLLAGLCLLRPPALRPHAQRAVVGRVGRPAAAATAVAR